MLSRACGDARTLYSQHLTGTPLQNDHTHSPKPIHPLSRDARDAHDAHRALRAAPLADRGGTHDGFFLRLSSGIGGGRVSGDNDTSGKFTGATSQGSIAIGGVITDNLALHADVFVASLFNPTYENKNGTAVTLNDLDITMRFGSVGVGVTYYIMPMNLYLCGSLGLAVASTEVRYTRLGLTFTDTWESQTGFGLNLMVGKEWWVSDNWGLGVAGQFIYANIPVKDKTGAEDSFSGGSLGVLFSATYN